MAISRLTGQDATGTSLTTSVSAIYASTPTLNNLLIAIVASNNDGNLDTIAGWTLAIESSGSPASDISILYKVSNGAESTTVTANNTGASLMELAIFEYSGLATSSVLDKTATGNGVGTTVSTGTTATTTIADELLIVGVGSSSLQTATSWSNSFTTRQVIGTVNTLLCSDRIVSATGAYETTLTGGNVTTMGACIATFKTPSSTITPASKNLTLLGVS